MTDKENVNQGFLIKNQAILEVKSKSPSILGHLDMNVVKTLSLDELTKLKLMMPSESVAENYLIHEIKARDDNHWISDVYKEHLHKFFYELRPNGLILISDHNRDSKSAVQH